MRGGYHLAMKHDMAQAEVKCSVSGSTMQKQGRLVAVNVCSEQPEDAVTRVAKGAELEPGAHLKISVHDLASRADGVHASRHIAHVLHLGRLLKGQQQVQERGGQAADGEAIRQHQDNSIPAATPNVSAPS